MDLVQLSVADVAVYRARLLRDQGGKCAICKLVCAKPVLDHQHKRRQADPNGPNGDGLVRGVLCDGCNRIEGKVWNNAYRFGKHHLLPELLRNMADYLEQDNHPWIHPSEKPRPRRVSKRRYNELAKVMKEKEDKCPPRMPLSKKGRPMAMGNLLLACFKRHGIKPYLS